MVRPATLRDQAIDRLCRVAEQMSDEEFQTWFNDAIRAAMPLTLSQIITIAEIEAEHPTECGHCNDARCTYKTSDTIPY